ncbi:thylakoid-associated phosphatase 38, PROTEIN PHOSPHATASE 1 [Hibiscus trionum]|uniref:protein-serine/threonine phosphatase n=1 Tax=Hibiscus trionum TaxID=183268 RepID=A0A9W7MNY8_HIBTR|nr:thylakoid-associated phosphatase 38, PROTEIN PHOSPHATASE 1 [Hibiscus trionum]
MALPTHQLQRFLAIQFNFTSNTKISFRNQLTTSTAIRSRIPCRCSAIAINAPSSLADVSGIRWGSASVQGRREEMEDDLVIRSDGLDGFSFAALFDGHGGVSSVKYLRDELYKECVTALQGGILLKGDFNSIKKALADAFDIADKKLLNWLEKIGDGNDESGSTATVMLIGNEVLFISHVGDSCVVLSRAGKVQILTDSHRPYGSNQASLQEIKRIREAGGWISNGRICGDIAVSRAFGDTRFKTKKNEMLKKGVEEKRWSEKFISRVVFNDDLVIASPDTFKVALGSDAEFVLLASDGLWDYINSSDAVSFVRNQLREHGDVQVACDALAQAALDKGSQDNVSIIIADLGHTEWQKLPVEQQNFLFEFGQAVATVGVVSLGIWLSSQVSF